MQYQSGTYNPFHRITIQPCPVLCCTTATQGPIVGPFVIGQCLSYLASANPESNNNCSTVQCHLSNSNTGKQGTKIALYPCSVNAAVLSDSNGSYSRPRSRSSAQHTDHNPHTYLSKIGPRPPVRISVCARRLDDYAG